MSFLASFAVVFGAVAIAEMADKSQLVVLTQAARGRPWLVWLAASAAFAVLVGMAVVAGALVARSVDPRLAAVVGGGLFLALGAVSLRAAIRAETDEKTDALPHPGTGLRFFLTTFGLVFLSEFGDKTQFAVIGFAAMLGDPVAVAAGAWAAESVVSLVGAAVGGTLLARLPRRAVEATAGAVFVATGILTLVLAFL